MILFLSSTSGSAISVDDAAIAGALSHQLSSVTQRHGTPDSLYSVEWRGKAGRQVVEVRRHRNFKAIEIEGELDLIAPLVLLIRSVVSAPSELMLFDEGYSANLVLTEATSPDVVIDMWRAG